MMEKEFIPYELAVKLKELGFNEPSFGYWLAPNDTFLKEDLILNLIEGKNNKENGCFAPLWQQAFDWVREQYGIKHYIYEILDDRWVFVNWGKSISKCKLSETYHTNYEEARLECLKKLIEIVKDEKL